MTKIEEFLTHFDDQHLASLQCAAEDGQLIYFVSCKCLLHHHQGDYWKTKHNSGDLSRLAAKAEWEFSHLGFGDNDWTVREPGNDDLRRQRILPLIHAEWGRRSKEKMPQQISEIEELQPVSPNLR